MAFGFIKSQLLKVIEWTDDSTNLLVYKYPMDGKEIMNNSKLTVRESQLAIFVHKGKIADVFEPGLYKLNTDNLPVLTKLMSLPYGFNSPFKADIYFINTKQFTNQKWGTSNPIIMRDKEFGAIRIRGYGSYSFKVGDAVKFLKELFGTNSSFRTEDITNYLRSMLVTTISDTIAESKISALDLATNLLEFSQKVKTSLITNFEKLGLLIVDIFIENISFPDEVEKAIDTRSSMGVMGDKMNTFVKYQTAHAIRDAAQNTSGNNLAGAGISLGAGLGMGKVFSDALKLEDEKPAVETVETIECPNCKFACKKKAKFCPECGQKLVVKAVCPKCKAEVSARAKFCPECGEKITKAKKLCKKCGAECKGKFCPECGEKIGE